MLHLDSKLSLSLDSMQYRYVSWHQDKHNKQHLLQRKAKPCQIQVHKSQVNSQVHGIKSKLWVHLYTWWMNADEAHQKTIKPRGISLIMCYLKYIRYLIQARIEQGHSSPQRAWELPWEFHIARHEGHREVKLFSTFLTLTTSKGLTMNAETVDAPPAATNLAVQPSSPFSALFIPFTSRCTTSKPFFFVRLPFFASSSSYYQSSPPQNFLPRPDTERQPLTCASIVLWLC